MSVAAIALPLSSQKSRKVQKKAIINEQIFGKSLDKIAPEEGITGLTIQADEIGNIPGTIEHWWHEIELRKKDILTHTNRTFLQRIATIMKPDSVAAGTSGQELAKFHPLKKAKLLVQNLKINPQDTFLRLQLVAMIGQANRSFPIEFYRSMMLQTIVACSFGEVSLQGLQIASWAQSLYLRKLFNLCENYQEKLKHNLDSIKNGEDAFWQRYPLENKIKEVQRNIKILQAYQIHADKSPQNRASTNWTISLDEIQNVYLSTDHDKKKQASIVKKTTRMVDIIRYIVLLHPIAHDILDLFIKMENKEPIGHFLKARIYMSAMIFSVGQYEGGERTPQIKQKIQENFKKAYHQYRIAVKKMGQVPQDKTHVSILIEYANVILYFYQIATYLLEIKLPTLWLQTAMQRANKSLVMAQESGKVEDLQALLLKIVEAEKLEAETVFAYS